MTRGIVATILVTVLGLGALWLGTDGLQAFTAETARRAEILRQPRTLPIATLEDQDGRRFSLGDYQGRLLLVEFIYTRCPMLCRSLGIAFKQIRDHVPSRALGKDLALISISFDGGHDGLTELKAYGQAHGADGDYWRIARVRDETEQKRLLNAFGIVVISDGLGGFEHNAAIHLLGRDGRLMLISDIETPLPLAARITRWL